MIQPNLGSAAPILDGLHRDERGSARDVRQTGDFLAEDLSVTANVGCAYLQKIVEAAGDHVALLDFGNALYGSVELAECALARIGQLHFCECDMIHAHG